MWRKLAMAAASTIVLAAPAAAIAQPPTPPQIVHKVDRDVRRAVTNLDHKVHRRRVRTRRTVRHSATTVRTRRVRALCNDGRVHVGRTRATACVGHGGTR
jgi:hypothetical protein